MTPTFRPALGGTLALTSSGFVNVPAGAEDVIITVFGGSAMSFARITEASDASPATAADMPCLPNLPTPIGKASHMGGSSQQVRVSVLVGAGSTVYITPGWGQ